MYYILHDSEGYIGVHSTQKIKIKSVGTNVHITEH